jgi:hypothetical protein
LFRDELRILMTPEQVMLARIGRAITWTGVRRRLVEKKVIACTAFQGETWAAAVQVLEKMLAGQAGRAFATVILSNHFVRYALLPWSDVPASEEEEMSYARHIFRQGYGAAADGWELRITSGRIGAPQLASAVDKDLPGELRAVFGRAGIVLESIQPHLMAACNACWTALRGRNAWFALVEPGSLCLALLREGSWESVRTMRMDGDGRVALPLMLERESCLVESAAAIDEVLLWAPWMANAQVAGGKRWNFRRLQPQFRAGLVPEPHSCFAAALSGCA